MYESQVTVRHNNRPVFFAGFMLVSGTTALMLAFTFLLGLAIVFEVFAVLAGTFLFGLFCAWWFGIVGSRAKHPPRVRDIALGIITLGYAAEFAYQILQYGGWFMSLVIGGIAVALLMGYGLNKTGGR